MCRLPAAWACLRLGTRLILVVRLVVCCRGAQVMREPEKDVEICITTWEGHYVSCTKDGVAASTPRFLLPPAGLLPFDACAVPASISELCYPLLRFRALRSTPGRVPVRADQLIAVNCWQRTTWAGRATGCATRAPAAPSESISSRLLSCLNEWSAAPTLSM